LIKQHQVKAVSYRSPRQYCYAFNPTSKWESSTVRLLCF